MSKPYGYFVSGHVRLHPSVLSQGATKAQEAREPITAPYDGYLSVERPVDSQEKLDALGELAKISIRQEMGHKYVVGDLILRTVNLIYRPGMENAQ